MEGTLRQCDGLLISPDAGVAAAFTVCTRVSVFVKFEERAEGPWGPDESRLDCHQAVSRRVILSLAWPNPEQRCRSFNEEAPYAFHRPFLIRMHLTIRQLRLHGSSNDR